MKNKYIVEITKKNQFFTFTGFIHRVNSYQKGEAGSVITFDINRAHLYCSEKNALKPAQAYGGTVKIV